MKRLGNVLDGLIVPPEGMKDPVVVPDDRPISELLEDWEEDRDTVWMEREDRDKLTGQSDR